MTSSGEALHDNSCPTLVLFPSRADAFFGGCGESLFCVRHSELQSFIFSQGEQWCAAILSKELEESER